MANGSSGWTSKFIGSETHEEAWPWVGLGRHRPIYLGLQGVDERSPLPGVKRLSSVAFDIRPNRLAVQTWLTQSGVNTHRGFAMLTVVFLAAIFACFQLLGMWLRLKAMEQKFDYLMELLLAPTTEEQPPRQN